MDEVTRAARRAALDARRERLSVEQRALLERGPRREATARSPCLIPLAMGSGAPLFLVHPAGGDALCFSGLAARLPGRTVYGLQSPGLAGERAPLSKLEALASHYVELIRQVQPQGPYFLAGWSLGAHVVFEMAQLLSASGASLGLVALLDADPHAPHSRLDEASFERQAPWLWGIAEYLERVFGARLGLTLESLEATSPEHQLVRFVEALRVAGLRQVPVPTTEQLTRLLAVYRSNIRALASYRPRRYRGAITLLLADGAPEARARFRAGWASLTDGPLTVLDVPGDHYTLLTAPHVDTLAAVLDAQLPRRHESQ